MGIELDLAQRPIRVRARRPRCLVVVFVALALFGCATPSADTVAHRADRMIRDLVAADRFQGAVVLSRHGHIEYAAGFGMADIERRVPFTPQTPIDGASLAKTFTAAAVLTLIAQGHLSAETPVQAVLPEFPHASTRIRHLLAHSAGLVDYAWLDERAKEGVPRTNALHLEEVARATAAPQFPPGTAYQYDNLAYDMAALVIERVTGTSYAAFINRQFAAPLKLMSFVRPARFEDWPGVRTRGYRRTATGWADHDAFDLEGFYGGANVYLSALDLNRWVAGYRNVVGTAVYDAAMTPAQLNDGRHTGLTLGSWYRATDARKRYYTGHHNGFYGFGYADDEQGLAIAWVANDTPPAWLQPALSRALIAIMEGRQAQALVEPAMQASPQNPSGSYDVHGVGTVTVQVDGAEMRVTLNDVAYQAFPIAKTVQYVPGLDAYLRFSSTPAGAVQLSWDSVFGGSQWAARQ